MKFKVTTKKMIVRKQQESSNIVMTNCDLPHPHQNCRLLKVEGDLRFVENHRLSPEQQSHLNCLLKPSLYKSFLFLYHRKRNTNIAA